MMIEDMFRLAGPTSTTSALNWDQLVKLSSLSDASDNYTERKVDREHSDLRLEDIPVSRKASEMKKSSVTDKALQELKD